MPFCCLSVLLVDAACCSSACTGALIEQRAVPAMVAIVKVAAEMSKPEYLHRCLAMTIRNLSATATDPLKVPHREQACPPPPPQQKHGVASLLYAHTIGRVVA